MTYCDVEETFGPGRTGWDDGSDQTPERQKRSTTPPSTTTPIIAWPAVRLRRPAAVVLVTVTSSLASSGRLYAFSQ